MAERRPIRPASKTPPRPAGKAPARRTARDEGDAPAKASKTPLLIALGLTTAAAIGLVAFVFAGGEKAKPVAAAPAIVAAPVLASAPAATQPAKPKSIIKELPEDIRKDLVGRAGKISDKVDPLERRYFPFETRFKEGGITEWDEAVKEIESLQGGYAELAEELDEMITDAKYRAYFEDPAYGPSVKQFLDRTAFYASRLSSLKKMKTVAMAERSKQGG